MDKALVDHNYLVGDQLTIADIALYAYTHVAEEGGFVYEPPGEVHTLVVDEGVDEMITMFNVNGAMLYLDDKGDTVGYEDVFTKINMCRAHYDEIGLGAQFIDQFVR